MQIEIKLLNNFYTQNPKLMKGLTSKDLTIEQGEIGYTILKKILDRLCKKEDNSWREELEELELKWGLLDG